MPTGALQTTLLIMLQKLSALPILAFVLLAAALPATAQTQQQNTAPPDYYWPGPGHMMWRHGFWGGGYGMFWEFPMVILVIILLGILIFYFARATSGGQNPFASPSGDPSHSALQILNERYAKGEIQNEEYEERKATLLAGSRR